MRCLEIGCAPGKTLAWISRILKADVCGVDSSRVGIEWASKLFVELNIQGDLRCEDIFSTSFASESFDIVISFGVIEHFDDPSEIVRVHAGLLKPGGKAIITVPHFGGRRADILRCMDYPSAEIHNLSIMSINGMRSLAPTDLVSDVRAYAAGRMSLWHFGIEKRLPRLLATAVLMTTNLIGLLQPFDIAILCPMLVLEMRKLGGKA